VQGVRQLGPLEILASAPGGLDLSEKGMTGSGGLLGPGIADNPTLIIDIPPVR
jgi:hypothetical protein